MTSKQFHLGDVLSITDGRLLSPRHIAGVSELLNFMTGDKLFTHQLPRAMKECKPYLLKQHPQLENVEIPEINGENFQAVLESLCAEYGEYLMVNTLPEHAHEFIDAHSELAEKIHPEKIITFKP